MENKNLKISLALAITSVCNLKCFYCKASGENLENSLGTIDFNFLKKIIISSYESCNKRKYKCRTRLNI